MQIILTEQEYADLKKVRGVDIEAVKAAKQELVRKLSTLLQSPKSMMDASYYMREALGKFEDEISAAVTKAAASQ
jgi:hypothetical protein